MQKQNFEDKLSISFFARSRDGGDWTLCMLQKIREMFTGHGEPDIWAIGGGSTTKPVRLVVGVNNGQEKKRVFFLRNYRGYTKLSYQEASKTIDAITSIQPLADSIAWLQSLREKVGTLDGKGYFPGDFAEADEVADEEDEDETRDDNQTNSAIKQNVPLNQILYGPPGTGKTYETIYAALQILDPAAADAYKQVDDDKAASPSERLAAREKLKQRFDELSAEQRVRFVTFHQSFSYEDFVEGLRAETVNGQLQYRVEAGVFKQICDDASATPESVNLDALLDAFIEQVAEEPQMLKTPTGKQFQVSYGEGNTTLTCEPQASKTAISQPANIEYIRAVLTGQRVDKLYCASYVKGIAEHIRKQLPSPAANLVPSTTGLPHVLIIDEINRGNISRIFGELITLIEPSKRAGADEALPVTLPYSKETFSVPANVYIIGTMNTADRSLAGLDLALRRRFSFTEMPPQPELLDGVVVDGVNIGQLLRVMNQRITVLLDRDHTIGHAYFMPLQTTPTLAGLADIFRQKILPLLQEYFFEDWERIRWVLNDQTKPQESAFIIEDKSLEVSALFQGVADKLRQSPRWTLNDQAFAKADAYRGIAAKLDKGEA